MTDHLQRSSGDTWNGGTIYDPSSGHTYRCELRLDGDDRLRPRGYVGVRWPVATVAAPRGAVGALQDGPARR